jgi:hypothetical protein
MLVKVKFGENSPVIESLNNGILNAKKETVFLSHIYHNGFGGKARPS